MKLGSKNEQETADLSRSESIFQALRDDILSLRISVEDKLFESTVAERYAASRSPVREALHRLVGNGLLQRRGRAYVLPEINYEFVDNIYSVREALECKALELFVDNHGSVKGTKAPMDAMERAFQAADYRAFSHADIEFHAALAKGSGNQILEDLLTAVWDRAIYIRNAAFREPVRLENSIQEHRRIVEALERGQKVIAVEEMRAHLQSVPELLKRNI